MLLDVLERAGFEDLRRSRSVTRTRHCGAPRPRRSLSPRSRPWKNQPAVTYAQDTTSYEEGMNLDYAIDTLEPLLFLFGRTLSELCGRLRSQSQAARILRTRLQLARVADPEAQPDSSQKREFISELEFPVPLTIAALC